ncbi:MAG: hypothetical protein JOZ73_09505 [Solirubrobacterales bacterium]|nr:hypothetical protein [Solirubrobacterales bacterium]
MNARRLLDALRVLRLDLAAEKLAQVGQQPVERHPLRATRAGPTTLVPLLVSGFCNRARHREQSWVVKDGSQSATALLMRP